MIRIVLLVLLCSVLNGCVGFILNINIGTGTTYVFVDDKDEPWVEGNTANADISPIP